MVSLMLMRKAFLGVFLCGDALFLFLYMQQLPPSTLSSPNNSKEKSWNLFGGTEFPPSESKTNPRHLSEGTEFLSNDSKEKPWNLSGVTKFPPSESKTNPRYLYEETEFPSNEPKKKPWYFFRGTEFPKAFKGTPKLFPEQTEGDRITEQLMYVPEDYKGFDTPEKIIMEYNGEGRSDTFHGCPVNRCSLVAHNMSKLPDADAVLFYDYSMQYTVARPAKQVWILYMLECPYNTRRIIDVFNWTATYRRDSDMVAPYERWTYYNSQVKQKSQMRNYAANKTKKVAWFVSNCGARNGRLEYGHELNKYIPVDIYGACGPLRCPRGDRRCFELLDRDYKFYLAFENANCRDYISEKFYVNSLGYSVLPIVMGARPEDYERSAPQGSYIHVDEFGSAKELAAYLHLLDKDDDLYNSYFRWKGTGEFINTYFWCRLCAMLHAPPSPRHYENPNDWWRGPGVCTTTSWRKTSI